MPSEAEVAEQLSSESSEESSRELTTAEQMESVLFEGSSGEEGEADGVAPETPEEGTPAKETEGEQGAKEAGAETPEGERGTEAPTSWPAELRQQFSTIQDEDARRLSVALYNKLEGDMNRNLQAYQSQVGEIHQALAPVQQELVARGLTPGQGVRNLVAMHLALEENPATAIQHIAQLYNVDLASLFVEQEMVDPQVRQLTSQMQQMQQQQAMAYQMQQQQAMAYQQYAQQQAVAGVQAEIETFKQSHPLFDMVEARMTEFAQAALLNGRQPSLEELYDAAVWADPKARKLASSGGSSRKRVAAARREADGERSSGSSSRNQAQDAGGNKDTRAVMREILAEQED